MSWKIVPQFRTCSSKTSVSIAVVGPSFYDTVITFSWQKADVTKI